MDLDNIDLNIDNYQLNDILNLFNIDENYDTNDLKNIKKLILKLHPDKSKLDSKYFLFFKKVYSLLIEIYEFRNNETSNKKLKKEEDISDNLNKYFKGKTKDEFNEEFNTIFENVYLKDENDNNGYDEWMKTDDDFIEKEGDIDKYKNSLIENKDVTSFSFNNSDYYDYDSKDSYGVNDLKTVYYTDTIISVNEKDILSSKQTFQNINELNNFRVKDLNKSYDNLKNKKPKNDLDKKNNNDIKNSMYVAYKLIKKQETYKKKYNSEVSKYLKIKNKI